MALKAKTRANVDGSAVGAAKSGSSSGSLSTAFSVEACKTAWVHNWVVGGGIIESDGEILMVQNLRRNGSTDWSTPGGVIDPGETMLGGLTREVREETGLVVAKWEGPAYVIEAHAVEMDWRLRVEVHRAVTHTGELAIDDPDGIVVDACFLGHDELKKRVESNQRWVAEPLLGYLADEEPGRSFGYVIRGGHRDHEGNPTPISVNLQ